MLLKSKSRLSSVDNRMRELLAEIATDYDFAHFALDSLQVWIEERRGREILPVPWAMPNGLFGLWVWGEGVDYVFYDRATYKVHQSHIILHEFAHILCNHGVPKFEGKDIYQYASKGFQEGAHLSRSTYSSKEEQEAEKLAFLLKSQAIKNSSTKKNTGSNGFCGLAPLSPNFGRLLAILTIWG